MTSPGIPSKLGSVSVLFVDDEPAVTRAIVRALGAESGFEVLTATSATEAIDLLRKRGIDVLVSDVDMPGMNGLELVRLARREFPRTLRMLLTGAGTMDRAVDAINEGEVARFFAKPFDVQRFVHALGDLRDRILLLRRERHDEAQRERGEVLHAWIEERYPGTLAFERGEDGVVVIDVARLRAYLESAAPEVRALAGVE